MRFSSLFAILAACSLVWILGVCCALADDPPQKNEKKEAAKAKPNFTISKETTYLLGPVGPDGHIDYLQALNDLCSKGVTVENNACIPLLRALGPKPEGVELPKEFYQRLGIAPLPEKGNYFITWERFFEKELEDQTTQQQNYSLFAHVTTRTWSAEKFPKVAEWIKTNDKIVESVIQASRSTRFYAPHVLPKNAKAEERSIPYVSDPLWRPCRDLNNLLQARAMLHVNEKRLDLSMQELIACHRLARLMGQRGSVIALLNASGADRQAAEADLALLAEDKVSADLLLRFEKEIHALPVFPSYIEMLDKYERLNALDCLFSVERFGRYQLLKLGGAVPDWTTKVDDFLFYRNLPWDAALKEHNDWYNKYVETLKIQNREDREAELEHFKEDNLKIRLLVSASNKDEYTEKWKKLEGRAQLLAEIYRVLEWPALVKVQVSADQQTQTERNLHIATALARYQRDNHKYPEKLTELTPKYLPAIPQDVFNSKNLNYHRTEDGYLLYSVGVNGKDDSGRTRDDEPPGDDIVVRMPRAELKK